MKNRVTLGVGAAGLLFFGCITGAAVSPLVVPQARAGSDPQRWEFRCTSGVGSADVQIAANSFGKQGWEMAGAAGTPRGDSIWCFKRPLP